MTISAPATTYEHPLQRAVAAFHDAFGMPNLVATPGPLPLDRIDLRIGLIREEGVNELRDAVAKLDTVLIIDALIDTAYVALGALVEMGARADTALVLDEQRDLDEIVLLEMAGSGAMTNQMLLPMLESAFRRQDPERATEILNAIASYALTTLVHAGVDPQPFFDEVQRANMSKLGADGKPVYSRGLDIDGYPEGKVLKGERYIAPDLGRVWHLHYGTDVERRERPRSISADFERGVRAAAETMRHYFVEGKPLYGAQTADVSAFEQAAITDALRAEQLRLERNAE